MDSDKDGIPDHRDQHPHFNSKKAHYKEVWQGVLVGAMFAIAATCVAGLLIIVLWGF